MATTSSMRRSLVDLMRQEEQLAAGKRILRPSDDAIGMSQILRIDQLLEASQQYLKNIDHASKLLNVADDALRQMDTAMIDAHTLALENIGSTATVEQRRSAATLVDSIISRLITLGNTEFLGINIFAGRAGQPPFSTEGNYVKFDGELGVRRIRVANDADVGLELCARDVFGVGTTSVGQDSDLNVAVKAENRLADLDGALGGGIRPGSIIIEGSVNGAYQIDLSSAETLGDVVNLINDVLPADMTAVIDSASRRLIVQSTAPGETLRILDAAQGATAQDLGIYTPTASPSPVVGEDLQPRITRFSRLADLNGGAGVDLAGGITISNGAGEVQLDFTTAATVGDVLNRINSSGVGVQARINDAGTGIEVFNMLSGAELRIAETAGTTAADLGIRTFTADVPLSELNDKRGVRQDDGADFKIIAADGSDFDVDIAGCETVADVIDAINAAASGAGVNVTAALSTVGNGISITDNTGGAGELQVQALHLYTAEDLGLDKSADPGGTVINGDDVNPLREAGIFTYLIDLRDGLLANDTFLIEKAAQRIEAFQQKFTEQQGRVGYLAQAMDARRDRTEQAVVSTKALLSDLQDLDFTEAITRFQQLQTTLQASLLVGRTVMSISLLDFLR